MHENILNGIIILTLVNLFLMVVTRRIKQPYFIAYIAAGILLGPQVFGIFSNPLTIEQIGEIGIILHMFFIGAEINLPDLLKKIGNSLLSTFVKIILCFIFMTVLGYSVGWRWEQIILFTFIISLSSSALVFQYLSKTGQLHSNLGLLTAGVLIVQDILVAPMIITLHFITTSDIGLTEVIKLIVGCVMVLFFLRAGVNKKLVRMPFYKTLIKDHELQVFLAFLFCFGMGWITHWFGLSAALGSFLAGVLIGQDESTKWIDHSLIPFRVFFLSLFFIAVGLHVDLLFLVDNLKTILLMTLSVLIINSLLNMLIFRAFRNSWRDSVYAGALLSSIGEFSFVLINIAITIGLVDHNSYQITIAVITMTMLTTFIWVSIVQSFIFRLPSLINLRASNH